jgi:NAD(P)-dependent dehydrogenase (short-subunit alcohol dehydrogenase family)
MGPHGVHVTTIAPGLMRTGGHVNARFKGQAEAEAAWFKVAASAPLISTSAERIARQTVDAIRRGASMRVLPVEADLIARLHGAFPELVPSILSLISRALPGPTTDSNREVKGTELEKEQGNALQMLTTLGRRAGARLNQATQPGESPA